MSGYDRETVQIMGSYRISASPPAYGSLVPGEMHIEVLPAGGGPPRIWLGCPQETGAAGNVAMVVPEVTMLGDGPAITVADIDNPAYEHAVHIVATVEPGTVVELAAMQGTDPAVLTQATPWSPWDASDGPVDTIWYLKPGDNYRVRVRVQDNPQLYGDSNLFAVIVEPLE